MLNFTYQRETNLIFGKDQLSSLGNEIKKYGSRVLLTYGKSSIKKTGLYDKVVKELNDNNIFFVELSGIKPNPEVDTVRKGVELINENNLDFILAVGGGSVLDNSKHIAMSQAAGKDIWEIVKNPELVMTFSGLIKVGAVLTICATGSEMNSGGVISNPEAREKLSTGHPEAVPVFSYLDPTVLETLPRKQRSAGLCDIWSHLFENYFDSHNDGGFKDRIGEALMLNVLNYSNTYLNEPKDYEANAQIMISATYGLNGITNLGGNGGDWTSHQIEHELSAITDFTHGIGLALIQPRVIELYLEKDLEAGNPLTKYVNIGRNVFNLDDKDEVTLAKNTIVKIKEMFFNAVDNKNKLSDYDGFDYDKSLSAFYDTADVIVNKRLSQSYLTLTQDDIKTIIDRLK